jgi:murein DD-endopeptidase MepM/ murein hydrolase activator NlpD
MDSIIASQTIARRRKRPAAADSSKGRLLWGGQGTQGALGGQARSLPRKPRHRPPGPAGGPPSFQFRGPSITRPRPDRAPRLTLHAAFRETAAILFRSLGKLRSSLEARLSPPARLAAAACLLLGLAALGSASYFIARGPVFPMPEGELLPAEPSVQDLLLAYVSPELSAEASEDAPSAPPPPATLEIITYTVRAGDSLQAIAKRLGISSDSLISLNGITNARSLKAGTQLKVPNMDGLVHRVAGGDSLGSLAKRYKTDVTRLVDANDLGSSVIRPGQVIFIPGARLPEAELRRVFGELVVWPLRGRLSSPFGFRPDPFTGVRSFHGGIDIVGDIGDPVRASADGTVAAVGYSVIFGNYVILNHSDGMQSLYGHLSSIGVRQGQTIRQGIALGAVGNTGYSTGPHLHFGLFKRGAAISPLKYLK